jgi:3-dehydroquinate synthase
METVWSDVASVPLHHRVWWTADAFHAPTRCWHEALEGLEGHCVAFVDSGVAQAWPALAERLHAVVAQAGSGRVSLRGVETMPGGEACKDGLAQAERVARACFELGVSRQGGVIAIGGGAVLDAVGFGAAIAHRGVPVIRVPTTTLSQDDSAMGVKCGVNAFGQKNALGAFAAPHAVICCERLLSSLSLEHWLGGFSEAVKIALLKDMDMLAALERDAARIRSRDMEAARPMLRRSAELHRAHILRGGDPFEQGSARPLDHGHWAAHRLEALSGWRLPHGQAVAIGIAIDAHVSRALGLLCTTDAARIVALLQALGLPVFHPLMQPVDRLIEGLEQFRQHLGGRLSVPLITKPGTSQEVHEIPASAIREACQALADLG